MLTDFPAPLLPTNSGTLPARAKEAAPATARRVAWHYAASGNRKLRVVTALLASAAIHASAFLFIGPVKEAGPKQLTNDTPVIEIAMPNLKDLEEPEPTNFDSDAPVDATTFVPMQADLPQMPRPDDFVQKIDFNSLVERPDMSAAKVFAVPENINRGAIRQSIGMVFNLADLDRVPEPLVQSPINFPNQYRHDVVKATVKVQFIVDSTGRVVNAVAVDSTHVGFNEPAVVGVSKWKFRPGIKNGRRVNTRMEVPIVFSVSED